ncbi:MAG: redoxin domain-containing protein [Elusimicrobiota bacterium]|nr:redoxin domain-containing protein [Elusimicrobiota bacterium]
MRAALLALLLAAPAAADRPIKPAAPEFPPDAAWLNAKPLSLARLRGRKVVAVAFLNLASINSVRAMPALRGWYDRYWGHDLMVIGVFTPDLEVQRDPRWAKAQMALFKADFPVVLDKDRRIWKAYANEGWPALYLVDAKGRIAFDRLGEGGYREFEAELRKELGAFHSEKDLPPALELPDAPSRDCGAATAEVTLGARKGAAKPLALDKDFSIRSAIIVGSRQGEVALRGRWDEEGDGLRLEQANRDQGAFIRVVYQGAQALGFLAPAAGTTTRFFIKQDDLWLHEGNAGADVRFDDDGRSFVPVDAARLYDLTRDPSVSPHELYLYPDKRGAAARGFSFADACVVTKLR